MNASSDIIVIGAGKIGAEYVKVLSAMGKDFSVIGNSQESCQIFEEVTGFKAFNGGIGLYAKKIEISANSAIVAVSEYALTQVLSELIGLGVKNILVEKPAVLHPADLNPVLELADNHSASVYVAYNRRHYSSVLKLVEMVNLDGGIKSFNFEFTEWSHIVSELDIPSNIKSLWFWHNSTHVIDLAFYLGGRPKKINAFKASGLSWHANSIYAGAGFTENNALFSYQANWIGPGRWGIECITSNRKYILRPLEKLFYQDRGSVEIREMVIEDEDDKKFKPGFYKQVKSFLTNKDGMINLQEQRDNYNLFYKVINE